MKAQTVFEKLYHSEINARLQWQWDGGFHVALMAGYANDEVLWEDSSEDIDAAATLLGDAAAREYPASTFRQWWETATDLGALTKAGGRG